MPDDQTLPYKIAVLCDLRDSDGRVLMLHRARDPNKGLYSPIGGKLETTIGESPTQCARREIMEEAAIDVPIENLQLMGIISEAAYEGQAHWLLFVYRVTHPVEVSTGPMDEGTLDWHPLEEIDSLPMPESDRLVLWPMIRQWDSGVTCVHIDCTKPQMEWVREQ
ncbi:MAG: NUDIX hydrolase [Planctomycetota bacterium]|jgi:8-oxo-dGTP diphosphatase